MKFKTVSYGGVDLTTWKRRKNGLSEMGRFEEVGFCEMAGVFFCTAAPELLWGESISYATKG